MGIFGGEPQSHKESQDKALVQKPLLGEFLTRKKPFNRLRAVIQADGRECAQEIGCTITTHEDEETEAKAVQSYATRIRGLFSNMFSKKTQ